MFCLLINNFFSPFNAFLILLFPSSLSFLWRCFIKENVILWAETEDVERYIVCINKFIWQHGKMGVQITKKKNNKNGKMNHATNNSVKKNE